ncbi:MAG: M24 family metallopeptidase [Alphaproteobacteria bacterium]
MREAQMKRTQELQRRMADERMDAVLLANPDSIYYFAGYCDYAGVEIGRPTLVFLPRDGAPVLITPKMEAEMGRNMSWIADVREWVDGVDGEWTTPLKAVLGRGKLTLGVERLLMPALVSEFLKSAFPGLGYADASPTIGAMRMIKSPDEIVVMRQAGQVAIAMVAAAEKTIGEGVPEYEVALSIIAGGSRKAAEFLAESGPDRLVSPMIYNLQILQSGKDTAMVHRRSTVRRLKRGDPIYLCFCGIANFKQYKLGFDRQYFVREVSDEMARTQETTLAAQKAALDAIRPGVPAEDVHMAAEEVYRSAGFSPGYRTGRAIGCSMIEQPELKRGDRTPLRPGMTFAVDGGITVPGRYGARVGDSIVVTDKGFDYLTPFRKGVVVL